MTDGVLRRPAVSARPRLGHDRPVPSPTVSRPARPACGPAIQPLVPQEILAVKSAVETLNPTRVKLTVEVPFDELKPSLDAAYKTIASQVSIPGFRKGKVPPRIIDQRVGRGAVLEEAVNDALPRFYAQAVEESDVRPLGRPEVDVTEVPVENGGDLKFTAEVDVRPSIELPALDGVAVTVDQVEIADADVDARVETLRERFGTLLPADKAAADGDFLTVDIAAKIGDDEIDSVTGVSYQVGSGTMLPGLDEAVTGLSAGETTTFTAPLAGGPRQGEESTITVTVQAVKERQLPALDDDFAQLASEFDTLEELRADLAVQVGRSKQFEQGLQARERLLEVLLGSVEIPVPDGVVAEEVTRHLEQESRLEDDEHRAEVDEQTRTALRQQLLLDAVAEARQVSVSQQELIEFIVASAQQYGMDANQFAQAVDEAGQIPAMVSEVARRKALASVLEKAVITDSAGSVVDLSSLFAVGEDGEPGSGSMASAPLPAADDPTAVTIPMLDLPGHNH
jgi:trigger factor